MFRRIDPYDLNLRELVQTVQTAHILAVTACLTAETLSVSAVLNRQLSLMALGGYGMSVITALTAQTC